MLLNIYITTTAVCIISSFISTKAMSIQLKREGFKFEKQSSIWEKMHTFIPLLIPVFNIFLMFIFIFSSDEIMAKTRLIMTK